MKRARWFWTGAPHSRAIFHFDGNMEITHHCSRQEALLYSGSVFCLSNIDFHIQPIRTHMGLSRLGRVYSHARVSWSVNNWTGEEPWKQLKVRRPGVHFCTLSRKILPLCERLAWPQPPHVLAEDLHHAFCFASVAAAIWAPRSSNFDWLVSLLPLVSRQPHLLFLCSITTYGSLFTVDKVRLACRPNHSSYAVVPHVPS